MRIKHRHPSQPEQGAATLVVVMVLFFVMAMLAAFANRNLVFEQRISSNYYRTGIAQESAEAGVEWALNRLNGGLLGSDCQYTADGSNGFTQRYLNLASDRAIAPRFNPTIKVASCVNAGDTGWQCQCPATGSPSDPAQEGSSEYRPMFGITLLPAGRSGITRVQVLGCSGLLASCEDRHARSRIGISRAGVTVDAALVSALKVPPAAALTVRGNADFGGGTLGLHNAQQGLNGLLLQAGGEAQNIGGGERLSSAPGAAPLDALVQQDPSLTGDTTAEKMFALFFGMAPNTYRQQPAARQVSCPESGDCNQDLLAEYNKGHHILWVKGNAQINSPLTLGSTANPVLLVVNGELNLVGPLQLSGVVHARGDVVWINNSGTQALLSGALLSEANFRAQGPVDVAYHAGILNILNNQRGSFVRVPGSWIDQ